MKKWYQSKTIWGIAIAFLGFILQEVLKVDITLPESTDYDAIQSHIKALQEAQNSTMNIISESMSLLGTLIAIWGRVKAEEKLVK